VARLLARPHRRPDRPCHPARRRGPGRLRVTRRARDAAAAEAA
jgi:hypothetical protein